MINALLQGNTTSRGYAIIKGSTCIISKGSTVIKSCAVSETGTKSTSNI